MSSLIAKCDIVALYTVIDDAVKELEKPGKTGRPALLTNSEIITILVYNTLILRQKTLKDIHNFILVFLAKVISILQILLCFRFVLLRELIDIKSLKA